jgi:hypothetical protein
MAKFAKQSEVLTLSPGATLSLGGELALVITFGNAINRPISNHREIRYGCKYWHLACYWLSTGACSHPLGIWQSVGSSRIGKCINGLCHLR